MYGIDGRRDLTESTRDELSGYAGARPVRVGNAAFDQRQNDVFRRGPRLVLTAHGTLRAPAERLWPIVRSQAECASAVWRKPDQGIWEARGKPPALRLLEADVLGGAGPCVRLAIRGDPESEWAATADEIEENILEHGLRDGVLRQHYDTDALDASTLLAALFGFLPGHDERLRKSVEAIADELTEDGFVLRYRTEELSTTASSGKEGAS